MVSYCQDWRCSSEGHSVLILVVVEDGLVHGNIKLYVNGGCVLILVVVEDGLVL